MNVTRSGEHGAGGSGLGSAALRLLPPGGSSLALPSALVGRDWAPLRFACSLPAARRWRFPPRWLVGTGLRCASPAPSRRLVAGASLRAGWSGLGSAALRLLPPGGSSLALPSALVGRDWAPLR